MDGKECTDDLPRLCGVSIEALDATSYASHDSLEGTVWVILCAAQANISPCPSTASETCTDGESTCVVCGCGEGLGSVRLDGVVGVVGPSVESALFMGVIVVSRAMVERGEGREGRGGD